MSVDNIKIEEKIKKFEQALIPEKETFIIPRLNSILLALDAHDWVIESSRYSYKAACELSLRYDSEVQIICMALNEEEYYESEKLVQEAVAYLQNNKVESNGSCIIGTPSSNILKLMEEEKHDLIILPSPYAERVEKNSLESLGATVEILINKSITPLLLLTETDIDPGRITDKILIPIRGIEDIKTLEWALLLSNENSIINAFDIVSTDSVEEIRGVSLDLLEENINERLIETALRKNTAPLLKALRTLAQETGINIRISNKIGEIVSIVTDELPRGQTSLIMANSETSMERGSLLVKESKKNQVPLLIIK